MVVHLYTGSITFLLLCTHQTRRLDICRVNGFAVPRVFKDLAWVHQPMRIKGTFDAAHDIDCVRAEFFDEVLFFAKTDAVFALKLMLAYNNMFVSFG